MSRSIIVPMLLAATLSVSQAEDKKEVCPQSFSPWKQEVGEKGLCYVCIYSFEPSPGDKRFNHVVWYPTADDAGYMYYTNGKDKYWCRAFNSVHKEYVKDKPKWNVIAKNDDKKKLLNEVSKTAWGAPEHPVCAGSAIDGKPGVPMAEPPPPPIAAYTAYFESLKRK